MSRGKFYTAEEDEALMNLFNDFQGKKYVELADMALKYGAVSERSREAVAQHIASIVAPPKSEKEEETQMDIDDLDMMAAQNEIKRIKGKYESLIGTILGTAGVLEGRKALKLDYVAITKWLYQNEPNRVSTRIDELMGETD